MPLYHTMGDHSLLAMSLIEGCYVCQPEWDPGTALALVAAERISSLYLAPTLFHDLVATRACAEHDLSTVEAIGYAGAAMTRPLAERVAATFRPRVFVNHYGSTEVYTFSIHRDQAAKPGCAGRAGARGETPACRPRRRRVGPDDLVPPGEEGQIICHLSSRRGVRGLLAPPGRRRAAHAWRLVLHRRPRAARRRGRPVDRRPGRRHDRLGRREHPSARGRGRTSSRHPAAREVAVVGAPDDRWGQRVVAYVVSPRAR